MQILRSFSSVLSSMHNHFILDYESFPSKLASIVCCLYGFIHVLTAYSSSRNASDKMQTAFSPILPLGLAMMGFALLSSNLYKSTYTIVHRWNFLPQIIRNCSNLNKSSCFEWGPCESAGNVLVRSPYLVLKNVRKRGPLKIKNYGHLLL